MDTQIGLKLGFMKELSCGFQLYPIKDVYMEGLMAITILSSFGNILLLTELNMSNTKDNH